MNVKIRSLIIILALIVAGTLFFRQGLARLQIGRQNKMDKSLDQAKLKKSYLSTTFLSARKESIPKTTGFIRGIFYSENEPSTVMLDNNSIVQEKHSIHGTKIVKIYKDKVEFAKNGHRWTQKVGEKPSTEWYK
jgi:predicted transcriptional regulator